MNLRVTKDAVRVRATLEEAKLLLDRGRISEELALMELTITHARGEGGVLSVSGGGLRLDLPSAELERLLSRAADSPSRDELALEGRSRLADGRDVEWSFEVDRFSLRDQRGSARQRS